MATDQISIGPYLLHEKLGSHRRHHVYRAVDQESGKAYAVKLVNVSSRVERSIAIKKIQLEAKILKRLDHPRLVKTVDAGVIENKLFIVMELVEGESLGTMLARRGKIPWDLATEYALQVSEGLDYLHKEELVHLKLNPDKILITPSGQIKIADLRLNRARKRRWDEARNRVLDVAAYMAPEQMTDEGGTEKSDLYSLGVMMFEMITGRLPHEPDTLPRLIRAKKEQTPPRLTSLQMDCPVWLDQLVSQLLASSAPHRPYGAYALQASLKEVQRMQQEGRSVAEELTRGFNPLTVGKDKTEAFKVLGRKSEPKATTKDEKWKTGLIAASLVLTTAIMIVWIWWVVRPPSEETLYNNAVAALQEERSDRVLLRAKRNLEPLLDRFPDGEYFDEAKPMYDDVIAELAQRRMIRRYRQGVTPSLDIEDLACQAWQLEKLGDRVKALELYTQASELEPLDDAEHFAGFLALSLREQARLRAELDDDAETIEGQRENISTQLSRAAELESAGDLVESRTILRAIIDSYQDQVEFQDLVEEAQSILHTSEPDDSDED